MLERKDDKTERFTMRLTKIESEKLKALSEEYNIPQSEIAREGIRYISHRQAKLKNKKK